MTRSHSFQRLLRRFAVSSQAGSSPQTPINECDKAVSQPQADKPLDAIAILVSARDSVSSLCVGAGSCDGVGKPFQGCYLPEDRYSACRSLIDSKYIVHAGDKSIKCTERRKRFPRVVKLRGLHFLVLSLLIMTNAQYKHGCMSPACCILSIIA